MAHAQQRRPIDARHPAWLIHVDVWNKADPQKIINLIPADVKPYVIMNLSLSCQYDTEKNVYKMPQNAVKTYKSWATVCQQNGMWFTCQPASGGHTHIQDDDLETFEYFFKRFPNFLGWNYAEQFWGFDEAGDKSSSSQASRIALFAKLVPMHHRYGGFLTISFCGNIWSHALNPVGMMKRDANLLQACRDYPSSILWLFKYTTSSCFYNNESVTLSPFISGLASNYGVRYDNCGWNGALEALLGKDNGKKYPIAAGIGTVMEQTCVNGGAVWDGPELIWTEDIKNLNDTEVNGYRRRNWGTFPGFDNAWIDMFRRVLDGSLYIPTRQEVVEKTKVAILNNVSTGNDEQRYAAWGNLYDNLYKVQDPFNRGNGQWMDNFCYLKSTGRYGTIPICVEMADDLAKAIPLKVNKSNYTSVWPSLARKKSDFDRLYPEVSQGDLYVNRYRNQLITYTPYTYLNSKRRAQATIPLQYNTCEQLRLDYDLLSSGAVREYADHIDFYLNNYRTDTTAMRLDSLIVVGATSEPTFTFQRLGKSSTSPAPTLNVTKEWDAATGTFKLAVKHNGALRLTVQCVGAATDRLTDVLPAEPLSLDLPKQPAPYHGPIVIEAEDMDYKNVRSCVTDPYNWYPDVRGHAGNGFMDMGTNTAGALTHSQKLTVGGAYEIGVRYTNTHKAGKMSIKVNGVSQSVSLEQTAVNEWKMAKASVQMREGNNVLFLTNVNGIGCYIDNLTYRPADVEEEKQAIHIRESEHGVVVPSVAAAAEGEEVTLEVVPVEGYRLSGWRIIHGNVTVDADNCFTMGDEWVTLEPLFVEKDLVYRLDLGNVLNGAIPQGWRCVQENDDLHQWPNTYGSGSRVLKGFTGYQGAALYWREKVCDYGRMAAHPLTLEAGKYTLSYAVAAWKGYPSYQARIRNAQDEVVASTPTRLSATPNVNGNTTASLEKTKLYTLDFEVTEAGNYVIEFSNYVDGAGFQEFLLVDCQLRYQAVTDGVVALPQQVSDRPAGIYNLMGMPLSQPQRGVNIIRTQDGRTVKVMRR